MLHSGLEHLSYSLYPVSQSILNKMIHDQIYYEAWQILLDASKIIWIFIVMNKMDAYVEPRSPF